MPLSLFMPVRPARRVAEQILTIFCLSALSALCSHAQPSSHLTQRRINTLAAALQKTHRTLIEETGLRQTNEPFEAYFNRIAVPLPGESAALYKKRIEGYLAALKQAEEAGTGFRSLPALQDNSPENLRHWRDIVHPLSTLPGRIIKTQATWQREQPAAAASSHPAADAQTPGKLGTELALTMRIINSASDALRDARP